MGDIQLKTQILYDSIFLILSLFHWIYVWFEICNSWSWHVPLPYESNTHAFWKYPGFKDTADFTSPRYAKDYTGILTRSDT